MSAAVPPITSRQNQYRGLNAHLNSRLQQGEWDSFHHDHISDLRVWLNEHLRGTGYEALLQEGLQIRHEETVTRPESDVLIVDREPARRGEPSALSGDGEQTQRHPLGAAALVVDPDPYQTDHYRAVGIYRIELHGNGPQLAAWIELLSPSNKSGGRHHQYYLDRREKLLLTESCSFAEIDYLHESPPTILWGYPDYTRGQAGSSAYRVLVTDTRLRGIGDADLWISSFGVDDPLPTVAIPLHGGDVARLDLGAAYNLTYTRVGYGINPSTLVDYRQPPPHAERYSLADRRRIAERAITVIAAFERGIDLEGITEPLPVDADQVRDWLRAHPAEALAALAPDGAA